MQFVGSVIKRNGGGKRIAQRVIQGGRKARAYRASKNRRLLLPPAGYAGGGWSLKRNPRAASVTKAAAPVTIQTTTAVNQPNPPPVSRADNGSRDVNMYSAAYQNGPVDYLPVMPGNFSDFPSCSAISSQFQYAKFNSLRMIYTPESGTNTNGYVTFGVLADPTRLATVLTEQDVGSLPHSKKVRVSEACELVLSADALNTMFKKFPFHVSTDVTNATEQIQGYLVWIVSDVPMESNTTVLKVGSLSLSYTIQPSEPCLTTEVTMWSTHFDHVWASMGFFLESFRRNYPFVFGHLIQTVALEGTGSVGDPFLWTFRVLDRRSLLLEFKSVTGGIDHWAPFELEAGDRTTVSEFLTTDEGAIHKIYLSKSTATYHELILRITPVTASDALTRFYWQTLVVPKGIRALDPLFVAAPAVSSAPRPRKDKGSKDKCSTYAP